MYLCSTSESKIPLGKSGSRLSGRALSGINPYFTTHPGRLIAPEMDFIHQYVYFLSVAGTKLIW